MVRKLLLILLLILLPYSALAATDYYICPTGNDDTGNGTSETPWATFTKAHTAATSGDTIYACSQGTWTGANTLLNAVAGVTYDGATYGTGTRATLRATSRTESYGVVQIYVSNVTFKGFKIDSNELSIGGIYIGGTNPTPSGDITNITVDNCEVTNGITTDNPNPSYYYGILVGARGSHTTSNVTVTNCIVHDVGHEGIAVYPNWGGAGGNRVNTALIRGNIVYNAGQAGGSTHPIDICNDADNVTIEYNSVSGSAIVVGNYGPDYTGPNEYPDNFVIRYNLMQGTGFGLNGYFDFPYFYGSGAFYGNIITNAAISFPGIDYTSKSIKIYNNTIYAPTLSVMGVFYVYEGNSNTSGIDFKNNIVYCGTSRCFYDYGKSSLVHANNLFYRVGGGQLVWRNDESYTSANITNWEATAQVTSPAFSGGTLPTGFSGTYGLNMVPNTDYFQLTVDSPAKDAGATLASYTGAINGAGLATPIVRPLGAAFDIGAYEYGTVAQSGGSAGQGFKIQGVTIR